VNEHVTNGHLVSFVLDLAYGNDQTGSFTFSQKLFAPVLNIGAYTITEGPGSDNDGYFEGGETLILTINNNNTGGSGSSAVTGTLTATENWLTISPQTNLGAIATGTEVPATFNISISGNTPVSAGVHTIKWSFEKDDIGSVYPDQVYVDEIILPAHQVVVSTTNPAGLNFQSQIAPNPAKDATALLLQLPSDTEINYYLTDAAGHKILTVFGLSLSAGDHRLELPVSTLSSGMYFLSVGDRSSVVTHKVILR
jgi:hypothetical protein